MAESDLIRERIRSLRLQVDRIADVLAPLAATEPHLHGLLEAIVRSEVAKLQSRLQWIDTDAPGAWEALRDVDQQTSRVAGECLALVGGVAARVAGLDSGLCRIADHVVGTIASQTRMRASGVSVPAPGEYVDLMSEVIRVRFPGGGLWDLPVALHEYGHVVAGQLRDGAGRPGEPSIADIIERERQRRPAYLGTFAEELFADTFATYVAGPAYAYTCLRLRFDASMANTDLPPTHPSSGRRAMAILTAIEHLVRSADAAHSDDAQLVRECREDLRNGWVSDQRTAASGEDVDDAAAEWSRGLTADFLRALDQAAAGVRYIPPVLPYPEPLAVARQLRTILLRDPTAIGSEPTDNVIDLLNGAWLARRAAERQGDSARVLDIEQAVMARCKEIASV